MPSLRLSGQSTRTAAPAAVLTYISIYFTPQCFHSRCFFVCLLPGSILRLSSPGPFQEIREMTKGAGIKPAPLRIHVSTWNQISQASFLLPMIAYR